MDQNDILIFQLIAAVFTASFVILTYAMLRYLEGLSAARNKLILLVAGLERGLDPILEDLRVGASHFRAASAQIHHGSERVTELAEKLVRLASGARSGVMGLRDMLTRTAVAFLKN